VVGSNAEDLSRVDIEAVLVDVGVVVLQQALALGPLPVERAYIKLGRIEAVLGLNPKAGITWLYNVAAESRQPLVLLYRAWRTNVVVQSAPSVPRQID